MRQVLFVSALLIACTFAAGPKWHQLEGYSFEQYTKDFGRGYTKGTDQYREREAVFNRKLLAIQKHNTDPSQSYRKGVNPFTDMTELEWKKYNQAFISTNVPAPTKVHAAPPLDTPMPQEVDYRTWTSPRVLTSVKHQGSCGNCWAQSAAESLESYFALLTGRLPVLSTQQLTACTTACFGCGGGNPVEAWMYINSTYHGATEGWAYPFTNFFFNVSNPNATTDACLNVTALYPNKTPYSWFAELTRVGVSGYNRITSNSARATQHALATVGPLSIFVAAGNWQDYESGVFQNSPANGNSSEWSVDHVVQMVGYGFDKQLGKDYWLVRNSWSTNWGEDGFIRLDRPAEEPCSPADFGPACGTSGCLYYNHYPLVTELAPTDF